MKFHVRHLTTYAYESPVGVCHNELILLPRATPTQQVLESRLTITPAPAYRSEREDFFGNRAVTVSIKDSHRELHINAESVVERTGGPLNIDGPMPDLAWEQARGDSLSKFDVDVRECQYVQASPRIPIFPALSDYARASFPKDGSLYEACLDLTRRIHEEFHYDPGATHVHTPLQEVLGQGRGVCQDFAHLAVGCLRSQGLMARYVSGYLETRPPPGQERLTGADASHAWFSVFFPGLGWLDFDPTNNIVPMERHVTLAWGRDYGDVTPVKGVIFGGGASHRMDVAVDVERLSD